VGVNEIVKDKNCHITVHLTGRIVILGTKKDKLWSFQWLVRDFQCARTLRGLFENNGSMFSIPQFIIYHVTDYH
jgi:hypothetical protein